MWLVLAVQMKINSDLEEDKRRTYEEKKEPIDASADELSVSLKGYINEERLLTLINSIKKRDDFGKGLRGGLDLLKKMKLTIRTIKESTNVSHDAFLSHAQMNSADLCRSLKKDLEQLKVNAWYDMQAERLDAVGMAEGIAESKVFVIVATANYFHRPWCLFELLLAEILEKPITILMETVKSHGGFDNLNEFKAAVPDCFAHIHEYEVCEVKRRGSFWTATVVELAKRIKDDKKISWYLKSNVLRADKLYISSKDLKHIP